MKAHLECIPCLQRQALEAAMFVTDDVKIQEKVLRRVLTALAKMKWSISPPELAHVAHCIVREECMTNDPYKNVKKQYNDVALELYPKMKLNVDSSDISLLTAVRLAIAGNIIDFGANSHFDLNETISKVLKKDFAINDFKDLLTALESADSIAYLADNTGEIVFDKILLETILREYNIKKILFVVKGAPIINDATIEDAEYIGINKLSGVEFIKLSIGLPNTGIERNSREFLDILDAMDVVISKGQGNYEALSEHSDIFFLLMAKCPVIARDLNVNIGDIILKGT